MRILERQYKINGLLRLSVTFVISLASLALAACSQHEHNSQAATIEHTMEKEGIVNSLPNTIGVNKSWTQEGGVSSRYLRHFDGISGQLDKQNSVKISGGISVPMVAHQGHLYILSNEGILYRYTIAQHKKVWEKSLFEDHNLPGGGIAVSDDHVFVTTTTGLAFAVSVDNGDIVWKQDIGVPARSALTLFDDKLYFVASDGALYCLDKHTGAVLWNQISASGILMPVRSGGVSGFGDYVFANFGTSGEIAVFDKNRATPLWSRSLLLGGQNFSAHSLFAHVTASYPIVTGSIVYSNSYSHIFAFSISDGRVLWRHSAGSHHAPWVVGDVLYLITPKSRILSLNSTNGQTIWARQLPQKLDLDEEDAIIWTRPVLAGGALWLFSDHGLAVKLDAVDGKIMQQWDDMPFITQEPIFIDNHLYLADLNGRIHVYSATKNEGI